jgi:hypothetical protein
MALPLNKQRVARLIALAGLITSLAVFLICQIEYHHWKHELDAAREEFWEHAKSPASIDDMPQWAGRVGGPYRGTLDPEVDAEELGRLGITAELDSRGYTAWEERNAWKWRRDVLPMLIAGCLVIPWLW